MNVSEFEMGCQECLWVQYMEGPESSKSPADFMTGALLDRGICPKCASDNIYIVCLDWPMLLSKDINKNI